MAKLKFCSNRKKVQNYIEKENFILPISTGIITINESNPNSDLKRVSIDSFPFQIPHPVSWVIDLEKEGFVFSSPSSKKKTDSALLAMINNRLYVFMIELKTSINNISGNGSLNSLENKFIDTMERISFLLTINRHEDLKNHKDEYVFQNTQIEFRGIVFYNGDNVLTIEDELRKSDIYKILKDTPPHNKIYPSSLLLGNSARLSVQFFQNVDLENNPNQITVDFNQIFGKDINSIGPIC